MARTKKTTPVNRVSKSAKKKPQRKTTGRVPQAQQPADPGFLDLAPETRNEIYTTWAHDITSVGIRPKGKAHTFANHPATQISRQVHKEFCGILNSVSVTAAQKVTAKIVDLDFYPLITFLNRVLAHPKADYRDFHFTSARRLFIELHFTDEFWKNPPVENIAKWFTYLSKKVPGLDCTLYVEEVADAKKTAETMNALASGLEVSRDWKEIVDQYRAWEWEKIGMPGLIQQQLDEQTQVKTLEQQAADEYYQQIYAQMAARDQAERYARDQAEMIAREQEARRTEYDEEEEEGEVDVKMEEEVDVKMEMED